MRVIFPVSYPRDRHGRSAADLLTSWAAHSGSGEFPIASHNLWHGGVHLKPDEDEPIRCIADGEIVAYRINDKALPYEGPTLDKDRPDEQFEYSNGFVLVRHRQIIPAKTSGGPENVIEFYSLYMHLRPVTSEEMQVDDLSPFPFIFRRTHAVVSSDEDGAGVPIFSESIVSGAPTELRGVVPYGAKFKYGYPANYETKAAQEAEASVREKRRYRPVRLFPKIQGYAVLKGDEDQKLAQLPDKKPMPPYPMYRLRSDSDLALSDQGGSPTTNVVKTGELYRIDKPETKDPVAGMRYERLLCLPQEWPEAIAGFATPIAQWAKPIGKSPYHLASKNIPLFDCKSAEVIEAGSIFFMGSAAIPRSEAVRPNWKYHSVKRIVPQTQGFGMVKKSSEGQVVKASAVIALLDDTGKNCGSVSRDVELLVLRRPAPKAGLAWIDEWKYLKITTFDTSITDGAPTGHMYYADDDDKAIKLPRSSDSDGRDLRLWVASDWNALLDDAANNETGRLQSGVPFELLPDAKTPADHWARHSGWRRVTYSQPRIFGQDAIERHGFMFVPPIIDNGGDPQMRVRDCIANPPNFGWQFLTWRNYRGKEIPIPVRPWDAMYNGITVYAEAKPGSTVIGVLGLGTAVKLTDASAFRRVLPKGRSTPIYRLAAHLQNTRYHKLTEGGVIEINADGIRGTKQVTKRCEIPLDGFLFNHVVQLEPTVPIRRGDIIGYAGPYLKEKSLLHFEIFSTSIDFAKNPEGHQYGPSKYEIKATAGDCLVLSSEQFLPEHRILPKGTRSEMIDLKGAFFQVRIPPVEGWLLAEEVEQPTKQSTSSCKLKVDVLGFCKNIITFKDKNGSIQYALNKNALTGGAIKGESVTLMESKGNLVKIKLEREGGWLERSSVLTPWVKPFVCDGSKDGRTSYRFTITSTALLFKEDPVTRQQFCMAESDAEKVAISKILASLSGKSDERTGNPRIDETVIKVRKGRLIGGSKDVEDFFQIGDNCWVRKASIHVILPYAWADWHFIEGPGRSAEDDICDIRELIESLYPHLATVIEPQQGGRVAHESDPKVLMEKALRYLACHHHSEWDCTHNETYKNRLADAPWSMKIGEINRVMTHIESMQINTRGLPPLIALQGHLWHFQPFDFIEQLQSLGIVTADELVRIMTPSNITPSPSIALHLDSINRALDRYRIRSAIEVAHFLAQIATESGCLKYTEEENKTGYKGILEPDQKRFIGRGFIQTTHRYNYEAVQDEFGEDFTSTDDAAKKLRLGDMPAMSAALYFDKVVKRKAMSALSDISFAAVKSVSQAVNGGTNNLSERHLYFKRARAVLIDPDEDELEKRGS